MRESKRIVDKGRAYLQEEFADMQIRFVPAVANFLMVNVGDACSVFEKLLQQKITALPNLTDEQARSLCHEVVELYGSDKQLANEVGKVKEVYEERFGEPISVSQPKRTGDR